MSTNGKEKDFSKLFKTIAEIGGYVSTIIPYVLALLGKGSIPYPVFTATLTFIVSVVFLWGWRWSAIAKLKPSRSEGKKNGQAATAGKIRFQDYFRSDHERIFAMSAFRRRMEMLVLSVFALSATGLTFVNFQAIREELGGFHCLSDPSDFRVVILNLTSDQAFEINLANKLDEQPDRRFQICRYDRQVKYRDQAQTVGEKKKADLVIWGNEAGDQINIYLTAINWDMLNQYDGALPVGQSQEQAAFLAQNISAEILFKQGRVVDAQISLSTALDDAETQAWVQPNPALLAQGYFLLGLLFDPNNDVPKSDVNIKKAIEEYSNAIDIIREQGLNLEGAYLNRAQLYYEQGDFDRALADYSVLVDKKSEQINYVYVLRAQTFISAGRCSEAISELGEVRKTAGIETDPVFPYIVHSLGRAYLACGDSKAAQQTYQAMPVLSKEDAEAFLKDLNELAGTSKSPAVKEAIISIMEHIQKLQSE